VNGSRCFPDASMKFGESARHVPWRAGVGSNVTSIGKNGRRRELLDVGGRPTTATDRRTFAAEGAGGGARPITVLSAGSRQTFLPDRDVGGQRSAPPLKIAAADSHRHPFKRCPGPDGGGATYLETVREVRAGKSSQESNLVECPTTLTAHSFITDDQISRHPARRWPGPHSPARSQGKEEGDEAGVRPGRRLSARAGGFSAEESGSWRLLALHGSECPTRCPDESWSR